MHQTDRATASSKSIWPLTMLFILRWPSLWQKSQANKHVVLLFVYFCRFLFLQSVDRIQMSVFEWRKPAAKLTAPAQWDDGKTRRCQTLFTSNNLHSYSIIQHLLLWSAPGLIQTAGIYLFFILVMYVSSGEAISSHHDSFRIFINPVSCALLKHSMGKQPQS